MSSALKQQFSESTVHRGGRVGVSPKRTRSWMDTEDLSFEAYAKSRFRVCCPLLVGRVTTLYRSFSRLDGRAAPPSVGSTPGVDRDVLTASSDPPPINSAC